MNVWVQVNGRMYDVEIGDLNSRPIQAVVGSEVFAVWPEEGADSMAVPRGATDSHSESAQRVAAAPVLAANRADEIVTAPLPGDIVAVAVQVGETVTAEQLLCTVESMKMNNPVRSPRAGIVAEVMVTVGSHVNYGQPLVRLS